MSTDLAPAQQAPPTPAEIARALFRPQNPAVKLGDRISQMQRDGRRIVASERARWQRNREMYRGNQYLSPTLSPGTGQLHRLAPTEQLPSGSKRETVNRLRRFTDGRVAMLAGRRPPSRVQPKSGERKDTDAARMAQEIVEWEWTNSQGLDIGGHLYRLNLYAEQDGIAWSNCRFDRSAGPVLQTPLKPGRTGWEPITEPGELEALQAQDPLGQSLWRNGPWQVGEVRLRVVRCGALSVDPNMVDHPNQLNWIIESRRRLISELETETGLPVRDMLKTYRKPAQAGGRGAVQSVAAEDADGFDRKLNDELEVMVHELFIKPMGASSEWPMGAHLMWCHEAPDEPLLAEPWQRPDGGARRLPYYPYVPMPDGGHILRSKGLVDELIPMQQAYNRWVSRYSMWLDLASAPPIVLTGGSLRSGAVFNDKRVVHVNPGAAPPQFMNVPPDPGAHIRNMLAFIEDAMADVAVQSEATRGQAPNNRDWSSTSLNTLIQQDEQQLGGLESQFKGVAEWVVNAVLECIRDNYVVERMLDLPGAENENSFRAFTGAMLTGASRWKITGPVMPKTRAERVQMLMGFMQVAGPRFDPTQFAAEIIEGDVESVVSRTKGDTERQARETNMMLEYAQHPQVAEVWKTFTEMRDQYAMMLAQLASEMQARSQELGEAPVAPEGVLASVGINPPRVLDLVRDLGLPVPEIEASDIAAMHLAEIKKLVDSNSWDGLHPLVKQAIREHRNDHLGSMGIARQIGAMASQSPAQMQGTPGAQPPTNAEMEPPT